MYVKHVACFCDRKNIYVNSEVGRRGKVFFSWYYINKARKCTIKLEHNSLQNNVVRSAMSRK